MERTSEQLNGHVPSLVTVPAEEKHGSRRISKELDVAFVLRNILEVPEVLLEGYLKHLGDPLEGWNMELCGNCEETLVRAKQIYQEMMDAKRRFKELKFEIIGKIMSIQQGIKCGDKEPEVASETTEFGEVGEFPRISQAHSVVEVTVQEMEHVGELSDAVVGHTNQVETPEIESFSQELCKSEEPVPTENDNMLEFEYHIKTEPECRPQDSSRLDQGKALSKKKRKLTKTRSSLFHQYRQLAVSKNRNALHGLVVKDHHKKLPECNDGPVKCKCGKQFSLFRNLVRHVKEIHEQPVRCEICFQAQTSSKLVTFKRKQDLNRHVQTVHQKKLSPCPECGTRMRSDRIKKHLKFCQNKKC